MQGEGCSERINLAMDPFWGFAKRMLRYPGLLAAAGVCAVLSGGSLGAGLIGAQPVLGAILSRDGKGLPELAAGWNETGLLAGKIPQGVIDGLPPGPFTALVWIMVGLGLLTVIGATANFLHAYLSLTVVNRTVTAIRRELFHRVLRLPLGLVLQGGDGAAGGSTGGATDAISRIINDTGQLGQGLTALISKAVSQIAKGVGAIIAALVVDWRLTCIALLIAPILFTIIRRLGKKIRRYSKKALASQGELYLAATESLQGLRVVRVHSAERFEAGRFHRINKRAMSELNKVRTARALASPVVETLSIFVLGTLVLIAGKTIMDKHLAPDQFLATLVALGAAGAALKPVTGLINDVQQSAAGADRLRDLMESPPEPGHDARLPKLAEHGQSIEFRGVTLTYPRAARASLSDVNLTIRHGERVAVVGPNGCGKTTLLALIPRLFDPDVDASSGGTPQGSVLIDGVDIRTVNLRSLRRQVGVVTQETVLFKRSVRGNITYGTSGIDEAQMITAAKRARAHDFIMRLPQGYDTEVAEQGTSLSGGQRQRIAIARAILRDPAILILDEATSMIDAESEAQINLAINEFSRGRTTLIVAHRLSTVLSADRIVVMDHGRIVDSGSHSELLGRCEVYRQLARHQLLGQSEASAVNTG